MTTQSQAAKAGIFYPETDGKPMAETDLHRALMAELIEQLDDFFRNDPEVIKAYLGVSH